MKKGFDVMSNEGEKKLHIDSDWKEQARAEKERLAREAEGRRASPAGSAAGRGGQGAEGVGAEHGGEAAGAGGGGEHGQLPPATIETLVQSLGTQTMMFLSPQRDPQTGRSMQNLELAKHTIDLMSMLEEKTRGNLTAGEKRYLDTVLYQVRMAYVQVSNQMRP